MSTVTAVPIAPVKRGYLVWLWAGLAAALIAAAALAMATPQIKLRTLKVGAGPHPTADDVALINYTGHLNTPTGTVFDQSQQPTPMPVAGVVPGFAQGLKMMAKGGKYRLTIPPALGYGSKAAGPIPANSTLVFDVELLDFKSVEEIRRLQAQQQMLQQQMMGQMGGAGMPGGSAGSVPGGAVPGGPAGAAGPR